MTARDALPDRDPAEREKDGRREEIDSILRDIVYAPIGGEGLVQQTVRRLAEAIRLGLVEKGERLPPEAQLSEWLGISAMTLREALAILREAGLIETRRGRGGGTFVKRAPSMPSAKEVRSQLTKLTPAYLQDLTDYRKAITGEAAALAAERATETDHILLEECVKTIGDATDQHGYLLADAGFHIRMAEVSRSNRLLQRVTSVEMELNGIAEGLLASMKSPRHLFGTLNREHVDLVQAIKSGRPADARAIMQAHAAGGAELLFALTPTAATAASPDSE